MKWLTAKSRIEQAEEKGMFYLIDNEVFQDIDGQLYLTPRNYKTDNFSIPNWIAWLAGSKSEADIRASHLHDFCCEYHQILKINISEQSLRRLRLLKVHNNKIVCEDIPTRFLSLVPISKWDTDCMFKRALKATGDVPRIQYNMYRCGVFLNYGWLKKHKLYDLNKIYNKI